MPKMKSPNGADMDYKNGPSFDAHKLTKQGEGELISSLPSGSNPGVDSKVVSEGPRSGSLIESAGKSGTGDTGVEPFAQDFSLIK